MKIAAAEAIAALVTPQELAPDFIIPEAHQPAGAADGRRRRRSRRRRDRPGRVAIDPDEVEQRTFELLYEGVAQ